MGISLELLTLLVGLVAGSLMLALLPRQVKSGILATALLTAMLGGFAQPSLAAAVNDDILSDGQKALNETLKTTPGGTQYQGIEYSRATGKPLSDDAITDKVRHEAPDNVALSVSNGSVRISGQVSDRRAAQRIVQDIKEIPGVHEVSYDLGWGS